MDKCPKCGADLKQGDSFCRMCGVSLLNSSDFYDQNGQNNTSDSNVHDSFQTYSNLDPDDDLINAYIGKNADKLKQGGFSIYTFLFGAIYALYRKMWVVGFSWLFGGILINLFLPGLGSIASIGAIIWISIEFNKWYLNDVKENVSSIKKMYSNMSREQLIEICRKKGGTTIVPVIIISILFFLFIGLFTILVVIGILYGDGLYSNERLGDLTFSVPENSIGSTSSDNSVNYDFSFDDSSDSCSLSVNKVNGILYDDAKEYVEREKAFVDDFSGVSSKTINGVSWYYADGKDDGVEKYFYAAKNDDYIYLVEFDIGSNSDYNCSAARRTVFNNLRFE